MVTSDVLDFDINLIDNILSVNIKVKDYFPELALQWRVRLFYNGEVVKETDWVNDILFGCKLEKVGKYVIFIQAKNGTNIYYHVRECVWNYFHEQLNDYREFYASYHPKSFRRIDLYNLEYPYQNLAVISFRDEKSYTMKQVISQISSYTNNLSAWTLEDEGQWHNLVVSMFEPCKQDNGQLFYSGKSNYDRKLILGQNDIPNDVQYDEFLESIGYFTAIAQYDNKLRMVSDYLGMYPMYQFHDEYIWIVANSYHLLLLILKLLDIKIDLDIDNILPYFVTGERMIFEQLVSHNTFVKGCTKIPIHQTYIVDELGPRLECNETAKVLKKSVSYNEKDYNYLLDKTAKEITENVYVALSDNRYCTVITDVTGGKDSRTVLAAILNCPTKITDKVRINSKDISNTNDKAVFIPLNHLHRFKYDDTIDEMKLTSVSEKLKNRRSATMGCSFSHPFPWKYKRKDNTFPKKKLRFVGGGEMFLRTTFSSYFPSACYDNPQKLIESIVKSYNNGIVDYSKIENYIKKLLLTGLQECLGSDVYEKFNNMCSYYRNVYHFGVESMLDDIEGVCDIWQPLYNKTSLLAWHMVCSEFKNLKYQVEIIDKLCPLLQKVPFESEKDNKDFEKVKKDSNSLTKYMDNLNIPLNYDESEWIEFTQRSNIIYHDEVSEIKEDSVYLEIYEDMLYFLNRIIHYDEKFEKMLGIDLFVFIQQNKSSILSGKIKKNEMFVYNKLAAVSDILDIIEE